ncbi:hypothetical protein J2W34_005167 [Variovorax boronicumulans]|uniref:hypothetical protein n=1 Tax=Variovorax boronicumulans TaxID=436515 RepID=UPI002781A3BC|nr:hypothetical protein [Variovorax boronicumulans]MDQ0073359.1 hypothetical protein [Variovorax boronicumulans]
MSSLPRLYQLMLSTAGAIFLSTAAIAATTVELVEDPCPPPPLGYRIGIFDDGRVEMNGSTISTAAFKRIVESLKPNTLICWSRDRPESDDPPPNTWTLSRYLLQIHPRPRVEYFWDPAFLQRIVIP